MFIIAERNELNSPRGIYRSPVSGMWNFAGFLFAKTSANKRLLIMSWKESCRVGESFLIQNSQFLIKTIPPTFPSVNHFGCKDTTFLWNMQERLMVEVIFLLGEGLFTPKMIYSWQLVAISRNAMYLPCNECIKNRTALHRNTIIASLTAKFQKAHARVRVFLQTAGKLARWQ